MRSCWNYDPVDHCLQVTHLTIFIEDNQGEDDVTRVQCIRLFGSAGQSMDVAAIKKVEDS